MTFILTIHDHTPILATKFTCLNSSYSIKLATRAHNICHYIDRALSSIKTYSVSFSYPKQSLAPTSIKKFLNNNNV
jgi:hypothetical protein